MRALAIVPIAQGVAMIAFTEATADALGIELTSTAGGSELRAMGGMMIGIGAVLARRPAADEVRPKRLTAVGTHVNAAIFAGIGAVMAANPAGWARLSETQLANVTAFRVLGLEHLALACAVVAAQRTPAWRGAMALTNAALAGLVGARALSALLDREMKPAAVKALAPEVFGLVVGLALASRDRRA